jgi:hemin uptake protein HemP
MKPDQPEPADQAMQAQPPSSIRFPAEPGQRPCPPGVIPADLLFQGNREVLIGHNSETYRLRITKNGKLILTK